MVWLGINMIQGIWTELFHDEAYYWMFSQNLAWGYAEHAPMIALLIRIGSFLLPGEIGVRLVVILCNAFAMLLVYRLTDQRSPFLFVVIITSILLVHVGGFFAAPDAPLIFFCAAFFYFYKRYLQADNWFNVLGLALTTACVLYSKYHGLILIGLVLLSNLKMLRKGSFWLIVGTAFVLYLPHFKWLLDTNFATFQYHLFDRIKDPRPLEFAGNYVLTQLLVAGPLAGFILFPAAFKAKVSNDFDRGLKFGLIGFLIFLLILSFRTNIEANWSASAFIPLIVLAYQFLQEKVKWRIWLFRLWIPTLALLFFLRALLMVNFAPSITRYRTEFHGWPEWTKQIDAIAQGRKVAFINSYRLASKFNFYSENYAHDYNMYTYHKTQYDHWDGEVGMQGESVCICGLNTSFQTTEYKTPQGKTKYYRCYDNFRSFNRLRIEVDHLEDLQSLGIRDSIDLTLFNDTDAEMDFSANPQLIPQIVYHLFERGKWVYTGKEKYSLSGRRLLAGESMKLRMAFPIDHKVGEYQIIITLLQGKDVNLGFHGKFLPARIPEKK